MPGVIKGDRGRQIIAERVQVQSNAELPQGKRSDFNVDGDLGHLGTEVGDPHPLGFDARRLKQDQPVIFEIPVDMIVERCRKRMLGPTMVLGLVALKDERIAVDLSDEMPADLDRAEITAPNRSRRYNGKDQSIPKSTRAPDLPWARGSVDFVHQGERTVHDPFRVDISGMFVPARSGACLEGAADLPQQRNIRTRRHDTDGLAEIDDPLSGGYRCDLLDQFLDITAQDGGLQEIAHPVIGPEQALGFQEGEPPANAGRHLAARTITPMGGEPASLERIALVQGCMPGIPQGRWPFVYWHAAPARVLARISHRAPRQRCHCGCQGSRHRSDAR